MDLQEDIKQEKTYFLSDFTCELEGKVLTRSEHCMISQSGIYSLFDETPGIREVFLRGTSVQIEIQGLPYTGKLVREEHSRGAHYNFKFHQMTDVQSVLLRRMVEIQGFASPWKREFPRLFVQQAPDQLHVPFSVRLGRAGGSVTAHVINFSLHGILFEFVTTGLSLGEYAGMPIEFDLISNYGQLLPDCRGKVARIYDRTWSQGKILRGIAVQFDKMGKLNDIVYRRMIQEYCEMILDKEGA
jgi:hypothetical protein